MNHEFHRITKGDGRYENEHRKRISTFCQSSTVGGASVGGALPAVLLETRVYLPQMCIMKTEPININEITRTGTGPI